MLKGFDISQVENLMDVTKNGIVGFNNNKFLSFNKALSFIHSDTVAGILKSLEALGFHEAGHLVELALALKNRSLSDMKIAWNSHSDAEKIIYIAYEQAKKNKNWKGKQYSIYWLKYRLIQKHLI